MVQALLLGTLKKNSQNAEQSCIRREMDLEAQQITAKLNCYYLKTTQQQQGDFSTEIALKWCSESGVVFGVGKTTLSLPLPLPPNTNTRLPFWRALKRIFSFAVTYSRMVPILK